MRIHSERINFTPFTETDIPQVLDMYKEKDQFKYVSPLANQSDEFYSEFLKNKIKNNQTDLEFWKLVRKDDNEFIGTVNLNKFSNSNMIQIGCHLKHDFWNNGYASESLKTIFDYSIQIKKHSSIYGIFENGNIASKKIFEKLGFSFHGFEKWNKTDITIYKYSA
jgi:ribosomal-protein-alanine N-acetyltransferase